MPVYPNTIQPSCWRKPKLSCAEGYNVTWRNESRSWIRWKLVAGVVRCVGHTGRNAQHAAQRHDALAHSQIYEHGRNIRKQEDDIAAEYPLTVRLDGEEFATIVCSPTHLEEMTTRFLASEGIIREAEEIQSLRIRRGARICLRRSSTSSNRQVSMITRNDDRLLLREEPPVLFSQ